jgi:hypothetical protein
MAPNSTSTPPTKTKRRPIWIHLDISAHPFDCKREAPHNEPRLALIFPTTIKPITHHSYVRQVIGCATRCAPLNEATVAMRILCYDLLL